MFGKRVGASVANRTKAKRPDSDDFEHTRGTSLAADSSATITITVQGSERNLARDDDAPPSPSPSPHFSRPTHTILGAREKKGYLMKVGGKEQKKSWQKRWFLLRNSPSPVLGENALLGSVLEYYRKESASKAAGVINLLTASEVDTFDDKKRPHSFKVTVPGRTYYFQAKNSEEHDDWLDAIRGHVPRYMRERSNFRQEFASRATFSHVNTNLTSGELTNATHTAASSDSEDQLSDDDGETVFADEATTSASANATNVSGSSMRQPSLQSVASLATPAVTVVTDSTSSDCPPLSITDGIFSAPTSPGISLASSPTASDTPERLRVKRGRFTPAVEHVNLVQSLKQLERSLSKLDDDALKLFEQIKISAAAKEDKLSKLAKRLNDLEKRNYLHQCSWRELARELKSA